MCDSPACTRSSATSLNLSTRSARSRNRNRRIVDRRIRQGFRNFPFYIHGSSMPFRSRDDLRRLHFINALFAHATGEDLYLAEQIKSAIAFSLSELQAQLEAHPEFTKTYDVAFNAAATTLL